MLEKFLNPRILNILPDDPDTAVFNYGLATFLTFKQSAERQIENLDKQALLINFCHLLHTCI